MLIDTKTVHDKLEDFINARYVHKDGQKMLPVDDNTVRHFMIELLNTETDDDDFRSRA